MAEQSWVPKLPNPVRTAAYSVRLKPPRHYRSPSSSVQTVSRVALPQSAEFCFSLPLYCFSSYRFLASLPLASGSHSWACTLIICSLCLYAGAILCFSTPSTPFSSSSRAYPMLYPFLVTLPKEMSLQTLKCMFF